jgi:hypothetical protein
MSQFWKLLAAAPDKVAAVELLVVLIMMSNHPVWELASADKLWS